jgi:hypothetical protein
MGQNASGADVVTTTYGYDAFGARVYQIASTTATTTYPFKFFSVASSTRSGTNYSTTTEYVFNGDTLLATVDQAFRNGATTGSAQTSGLILKPHEPRLSPTAPLPHGGPTRFAPDPVLKQKKKQKSGKAFSFSIDFTQQSLAIPCLQAILARGVSKTPPENLRKSDKKIAAFSYRHSCVK